MTKDYQIDETETELLLHVPPANTVWKVVVATVTASSSLWFAGVCFYFWLARSESKWAFTYCIGYNVFLVLCVIALRTLYKELTSKQISFARHVVGIDHRILGLRVHQSWYSAYRVQAWLTVPCARADHLQIAFVYGDKEHTVAETLDADLWLSLVVRMQRKDFAYV